MWSCSRGVCMVLSWGCAQEMKMAEAEEYNWPVFIVPLLSFPPPTHTYPYQGKGEEIKPKMWQKFASIWRQHQGSPAKLEEKPPVLVISSSLQSLRFHNLKGQLRTQYPKEHLWAAGCSRQKKIRETIELRQAPRSGKNIEIYLFQLPPL